MRTEAQNLALANAKRIVVKIGSALLTDDGKGLDNQAIVDWVAQMAELIAKGKELVIVSSGSVAAGMVRLGLQQRPESLSELQAAAAVGQMRLVQSWESAFSQFAKHTAQVLLVHDDLSNRPRYLNARNTLQTLIQLGVIPIVNENDTVATEEIRFGDNDTLAAAVANLIDADLLVILTDQDAMYTKDPRHFADAEPIFQTPANDARLLSMAGGGGELGRGGMTTKVQAARLASRSGTDTVIVGGRLPQVLLELMDADKNASLGTLLKSDQATPLEARKLWLASLTAVAQIELDTGAVRAVRQGGVSVLPVGVSAIKGQFNKGDIVECVDALGEPIAKGLINYPSTDAAKLLGQKSEDMVRLLGYRVADELMHCDNLILL
ncbi:MAG: glutamate 5-kinase [Pseudomonadales bacterium]|nr:glutamate 5-kinase [Pseudomonadales bacterium]